MWMKNVNNFQMAKIQSQGVCCLALAWFFANFSLMLLIIVLLIKKLRIYIYKVWLIFLKCCLENLSFRNLMLGEKEWKYVAQQFFPAHRTINFSQLLKWNLLSETYSLAGSTVVFVVNFEYIWHVVLVGFFCWL